MRSSSFIPRPEGRTAEALAAALAALAKLPGAPRWTFVHNGARSDEPGLSIESWAEADDPALQIDLIRDDDLRLTWISVLHPDPERRELLLQRLRDLVPSYSVAELLADQPPELPRRSRPVAAALTLNGRFDPHLLARIEAALTDRELEMRANAAIAATLLLWRALAGPVAAAALREQDQGVRDMLRAAHGAIEAQPDEDEEGGDVQ